METQRLSNSAAARLDIVSDLSLLGSVALWGVGISQTFRFCIKAGREPKALKIFVSWLCISDTLRQIFTIYTGITLFFDTELLFKNSVSSGYVLMPYLCSALVAGSAQSFFAYRLWIVSNFKWIIPATVAPAVLLQLLIPPNRTQYLAILKRNVLGIHDGIGAITDILLSAGLCSLLWGHFVTTSSVLRPTKAMLQRLMVFSINTGIWTALLATSIVVVFFRTITTDFMVFGYFHLLSPLYFTTVMANLNVRRYLHVTGNISLSGPGTNTHSEMQFATVEIDEAFDQDEYRNTSFLHPRRSPWHMTASNPSSEALNPYVIESEGENVDNVKDDPYSVVAI